MELTRKQDFIQNTIKLDNSFIARFDEISYAQLDLFPESNIFRVDSMQYLKSVYILQNISQFGMYTHMKIPFFGENSHHIEQYSIGFSHFYSTGIIFPLSCTSPEPMWINSANHTL